MLFLKWNKLLRLFDNVIWLNIWLVDRLNVTCGGARDTLCGRFFFKLIVVAKSIIFGVDADFLISPRNDGCGNGSKDIGSPTKIFLSVVAVLLSDDARRSTVDFINVFVSLNISAVSWYPSVTQICLAGINGAASDELFPGSDLQLLIKRVIFVNLITFLRKYSGLFMFGYIKTIYNLYAYKTSKIANALT